MKQNIRILQLSKRLSLLYFFFIGIVIFLLFSPFLIFFGFLGQKNHTFYEIYSLILLKAINLYLRLTPIKWAIKDMAILQKIKNKKVLIISNHRSHLDMFLYLSTILKLRAVARQSIFKIPLLGLIMKLSKTFSLEKGNVKKFINTKDEIRSAIHIKDRVLVFPEMTRCHNGYPGIQKFRLFIFKLAREENVAILPIVLSGTDKVWPKGAASMDFTKSVSIKALELIEPNLFNSSSDLSKYVHTIMEKKYLEILL